MSSKLGDLKIYIGAATEGLEKGLSKTKSMLSGFGSSIMSIPGLGALLGGGFAAKGLLEVADSYVNLNSQLTSLLGNSEDAEEAQQALFEMSQKTKSSVLDNAAAYTRLTIASQMTGLSAEENVAVLGALNEIFAQSGTSADEAKRAIVQLSQGLSSGLLQGDELRSLRENAPLLLQKLADQLGVSVGQLKEMGAQGELTSERLGEAFRNIADEASISLGETVPNTAGRGLQMVFNAFQKVWDAIMDNTGLIDYIVTALQGVADWILAHESVFVDWAIKARDAVLEAWPVIQANVLSTFETLRNAALEWGPIVVNMFERAIPVIERILGWIEKLISAMQTYSNWYWNLFGPNGVNPDEYEIVRPNYGAGEGQGMFAGAGAGGGEMTITNNFNGSYSRSDVVNITREQQRQAFRK